MSLGYMGTYQPEPTKEGSIVKCGKNKKTGRQRFGLRVEGKRIMSSYDCGVLLRHADRNGIKITRQPDKIFILGITDDMYPDQKAEKLLEMYGLPGD